MKTLLGVLAITGCLVAGGCVAVFEERVGPPPHAKAWGYRAQHSYYYYPAVEVYYSPERNIYFWYGAGGWEHGTLLPSTVVLSGSRVRIAVDSDTPYVHHGRVKVKYKPKRHKHD